MKCGAQVSHIASPLGEKLYELWPCFPHWFFETLESFTHLHGFCAYCGWTSPNCDDSVFWAFFFFFFPFVSKIPFWGLPEPSLLWPSFVICDTSFRTMWRRVKLNYLFHHEKLSVISVLLLLGSSPTLCILVPRGQDACMICGPYNMPIILSTVF